MRRFFYTSKDIVNAISIDKMQQCVSNIVNESNMYTGILNKWKCRCINVHNTNTISYNIDASESEFIMDTLILNTNSELFWFVIDNYSRIIQNLKIYRTVLKECLDEYG